jgi:hypothetical protein
MKKATVKSAAAMCLDEADENQMKYPRPHPPLTINYTLILKMDGYNAFEKQVNKKMKICCKTATRNAAKGAISRNGTK